MAMRGPDAIMSELAAPHGIFVTGTDTGVGKTVIAAALARAMRRHGIDAGVMKPAQTGALRTPEGLIAPDARFLATAASVDDPPALVCPVCLEAPLAPSVAARLEGREISVARIIAAYRELRGRHQRMIVEGAGGLAVPIAGAYLMRDLARELGLPLLIVARPGLGTISHTLLTVEFARAGGLEVLGVLINNYPRSPGLAERTNPEVIAELAQVSFFGVIRHDPRVDPDAGHPGEVAEQIARQGWFRRMVG